MSDLILRVDMWLNWKLIRFSLLIWIYCQINLLKKERHVSILILKFTKFKM